MPGCGEALTALRDNGVTLASRDANTRRSSGSIGGKCAAGGAARHRAAFGAGVVSAAPRARVLVQVQEAMTLAVMPGIMNVK